MAVVGHASVTLTWFFKDETTPWANSLFDSLRQGETMIVRANRPVEVSNVILMAERRKRVHPGSGPLFFGSRARFHLEVEPSLAGSCLNAVFALAERHSLTIYDAAYLELSQSLQLPLATLDSALTERLEKMAHSLLKRSSFP